jgi:hypothetical protein
MLSAKGAASEREHPTTSMQTLTVFPRGLKAPAPQRLIAFCRFMRPLAIELPLTARAKLTDLNLQRGAAEDLARAAINRMSMLPRDGADDNDWHWFFMAQPESFHELWRQRPRRSMRSSSASGIC